MISSGDELCIWLGAATQSQSEICLKVQDVALKTRRREFGMSSVDRICVFCQPPTELTLQALSRTACTFG